LTARILIVDDHHAVRTTLRELLDSHSFQVCGDAKDAKEAIEQVIELKPDIVLLDMNMPGMNGMQAALEIRRVSPRIKILFLTVFGANEVAAGARLLADGYVSKSAAGSELIPALGRLLPDFPKAKQQA
jgi:DNA-binding NarL/FixJ family response regulator